MSGTFTMVSGQNSLDAKRSEINLLFQGDLGPLPDWFELYHAVRVFDQKSGWKMKTDTLSLKALIDLHMRHSHHHLTTMLNALESCCVSR